MRFTHHLIKIIVSVIVSFLFFVILLSLLDKIFTLDDYVFHDFIVTLVALFSLLVFYFFSKYLNYVFSNFLLTKSNKKD